MRILRIIPSMDPASGGPCQGLRNIIPELKKLGIDNEVVSLDAPTAEFIAKDNFVIHAIGPSKGPWAYSKNLLPWLSKNIASFDVVVVHALWLYHGYAFLKAFNQLKKIGSHASGNKALLKAFVMPHGMLDPYFQQAEGRKLKALRNQLY